MDNDSFLRQRRNLVTFSIAIILLDILEASLGTAKGSSTLSLFGGSFVFPTTNKEFLIGALWVGFIYFFWRYWIFGGRKFVKLMNDDLIAAYTADAKYAEYALSKYRIAALSDKPFEMKSNELTDEWKESVGYNEKISALINELNKLIIEVTYSKGTSSILTHAGVVKHTPSFIREPMHSIRMLWITFTKHTNFSEYLLPLILVTWAVIATLMPNSLWF